MSSTLFTGNPFSCATFQDSTASQSRTHAQCAEAAAPEIHSGKQSVLWRGAAAHVAKMRAYSGTDVRPHVPAVPWNAMFNPNTNLRKQIAGRIKLAPVFIFITIRFLFRTFRQLRWGRCCIPTTTTT